MSSDTAPSVGPGAFETGAAGPVQGPVKAVRLLLPVWNEHFIVQFLRISLPTLLSPGNLPALTGQVPCTFVFLTNADGATLLRDHPAIAYLQTFCTVEFDSIDDLITGDNYSTTLTLGYARAVRALGPAMHDTCFFFLISDYIIADGSLANVLARVQSGYNGVLAGNFQVVEEDAKESLFEKFETGEPSVVITSRDLTAWALNYLHPMTLANTVNFPIYHSAHSNRLFWRVDENTLIGRFYLMHMIAIRPEVADFQLGSSCDYSFVPEMCPSGKVHVVTDSDEYLVVEMQGRLHEQNFIHLGTVDSSVLATSLAEWTTERHRMNAHFAVAYHASDASPALAGVIDESRRFIEAVEATLPAPQPYRDHPYWIGAIAEHRRAILRRKQRSDPLYAPSEAEAEPRTYHAFLFSIRDFLLGRFPQVWPWHPRWPDYRMVQKLADQYLHKNSPGRSLVLSSTPAIFQSWLQGPLRSADTLSISRLLECDPDQCEQLVGKFDGCLLVLSETELIYLNELLFRIRPLLPVGDYLAVLVLNGKGLGIGGQFNHQVLRKGSAFFDRHVKLEAVEFVMASRSSWAAWRGLRTLFMLNLRNPLFLLVSAVPIAFLLFVSLIGNLTSRQTGPSPAKGKLCSSIGVVMRVVVKSTDRPKSKDSDLKLSLRRFMTSQARSRRTEPVEADRTRL